jgi:hypothetical protein
VNIALKKKLNELKVSSGLNYIVGTEIEHDNNGCEDLIQSANSDDFLIC